MTMDYWLNRYGESLARVRRIKRYPYIRKYTVGKTVKYKVKNGRVV